ncbi:MAG: hypothetical protein IK136_04245 [Oscillospiraceae bacterium]|nr:hypothetical protein [Oscillospiraceae bacterium]
MSVSFDGIGETVATFEAASGVAAGDPVKASASGKTAKCSNGERFCGAALYVSGDGHAAVRLRGHHTAAYTGSAPSVGYVHLVANGSGGVKVDAGSNDVYTGAEYLVTEVDTTAKTVGFWL